MKKHFILTYEYVADYVDRRVAYRPAHFAHATPYGERGELFLAGACIDPGAPIGVLLFEVEDRETVEAFARADPYVKNGIVAAWRVREWTTAFGDRALNRPNPAT